MLKLLVILYQRLGKTLDSIVINNNKKTVEGHTQTNEFEQLNFIIKNWVEIHEQPLMLDLLYTIGCTT